MNQGKSEGASGAKSASNAADWAMSKSVVRLQNITQQQTTLNTTIAKSDLTLNHKVVVYNNESILYRRRNQVSLAGSRRNQKNTKSSLRTAENSDSENLYIRSLSIGRDVRVILLYDSLTENATKIVDDVLNMQQYTIYAFVLTNDLMSTSSLGIDDGTFVLMNVLMSTSSLGIDDGSKIISDTILCMEEDRRITLYNTSHTENETGCILYYSIVGTTLYRKVSLTTRVFDGEISNA